jgi:hypothetical protein
MYPDIAVRYSCTARKLDFRTACSDCRRRCLRTLADMLRINASETPGSNPFDFGTVVLIAAERADHAHSTVFLCPICATCMPSKKWTLLSRCSPKTQPFLVGPVCCIVEYLYRQIFVFFVMQTLRMVANDTPRS